MGRVVLDTLASLLDAAFAGDPAHALLPNIAAITDDEWTAVPERGTRSIADVLEHVGWAKWMYENYAFGDATLRGDVPPMTPPHGLRARPRAELLAWLDEGHHRIVAAVRSLSDDGELASERRANWGARVPTVDLIRILIAHDFYHAGEINHLRALLQRADGWAYGGPS